MECHYGANDRAMGRNKELDVGKMPLEPEPDLALPLGVQVRVNFVDQDYATARDDYLAILRFSCQTLEPICADQMTHDIGEQSGSGAVAIAHLAPGELHAVPIL